MILRVLGVAVLVVAIWLLICRGFDLVLVYWLFSVCLGGFGVGV